MGFKHWLETWGMLKGSLRSVFSSRALWLQPHFFAVCAFTSFCVSQLAATTVVLKRWKDEKMKRWKESSQQKVAWDNDGYKPLTMETMEIVGQIWISKKHGTLASLLRIDEEIVGKLLPPSGDARFGYAESDALDFEDSMAIFQHQWPTVGSSFRTPTMNCTCTFCWRYCRWGVKTSFSVKHQTAKVKIFWKRGCKNICCDRSDRSDRGRILLVSAQRVYW